MKIPCDIKLLIINESGQTQFAKQANQAQESSSTIKIPLVLLTLTKMTQQNNQLDDALERLPRHASNGSGILNWTATRRISFRDLLQTLMVYSDCVATNMLLDYVGGYQELNLWLKRRGFRTRLHLPYISFSEGEDYLPRVGTTSTTEMLNLYAELEAGKWLPDIKKLLDFSMSNVNNSWLERSLPATPENFHHKTGSMIDCGPLGETIYNAVGHFNSGGNKYYFCLLTHSWLKKDIPVSENEMRSHIANYFYTNVLSLPGKSI